MFGTVLRRWLAADDERPLADHVRTTLAALDALTRREGGPGRAGQAVAPVEDDLAQALLRRFSGLGGADPHVPARLEHPRAADLET